MNKNIILSIGVVVSLVAVSSIFLNDSVDVTTVNIESSPQAKVKKVESNSAVIEYETTPIKNKTLQKKTNASKKTPKREKFLESKTRDKSGQFEIALINTHLDTSRLAGGFKTLKGDIDGKAFFLKVPKSLIDEGSGVTELRIKNLQTNEESSVSAAFINNMRESGFNQSISIDSKDIENYRQEVVSVIVPPRPGESIR